MPSEKYKEYFTSSPPEPEDNPASGRLVVVSQRRPFDEIDWGRFLTLVDAGEFEEVAREILAAPAKDAISVVRLILDMRGSNTVDKLLKACTCPAAGKPNLRKSIEHAFRERGMMAEVDFSCEKCGIQCPIAPDPPAQAICEECCEDHVYAYDAMRRGHFCYYCDAKAPDDWYD